MLADNISTIKSQYQKPDSMVVSPDAAPRRSKPEQKAKEPEIKAEKSEMKISQALLNDVQHEIQKMYNIGLQFSVHKTTGRTIVKVVDKETEKLIREIPSEDLLNLADKLDEMIGILFDKKV
ncbi:MAG: flagellar protein FlaG [Desulfobacterales bacterium]|nr:flagellar protein FlaG [Desulfobacterales bacterium]